MARPRKNAAASRASLLSESAPLPEIPVREQPYPLPEGWKWVRLGDVYTINPKNEINDSTLVSFVPMERISPSTFPNTWSAAFHNSSPALLLEIVPFNESDANRIFIVFSPVTQSIAYFCTLKAQSNGMIMTRDI